MSDNKKYYYLKLKENFFESDSMILLESMKDGYLYSNILMKLYLRSLKDNGRLMLNGTIPYNSQMLASVTRHQVGTLEKALDIFKELGLIEILDSGAIYMMDIQNFIGRSSTEADRQRKYYNRIESEKSCKEECKKSYKNSTPELEIEKEIDINNNICSPKPDERESDFEKIYAIYPKKRGRTKAFANYCSWLKGRSVNGKRRKLTNREMYLAVHAYVEQQKEHETELEYYKNFDTLMGSQLLDYVEEEQNERSGRKDSDRMSVDGQQGAAPDLRSPKTGYVSRSGSEGNLSRDCEAL